MSNGVLGFALLAAVLMVSALASAIVAQAPVSFPMLFLGLGLLLGPAGFHVIAMDVHSPVLEIVAIVESDVSAGS